MHALPGELGIDLASGLEIDSDSANAAAVHFVEIGVGDFIVGGDDAARVGRELLDGVDRAGVVRSVYRGLHDHDALDMQRLMERAHFFHRSGLRRVNARRGEREFLRIAEDVRVAVARVGRHLEIYRRLGLRGAGENRGDRPSERGNSGQACSNQNFSSS